MKVSLRTIFLLVAIVALAVAFFVPQVPSLEYKLVSSKAIDRDSNFYVVVVSIRNLSKKRLLIRTDYYDAWFHGTSKLPSVHDGKYFSQPEWIEISDRNEVRFEVPVSIEARSMKVQISCRCSRFFWFDRSQFLESRWMDLDSVISKVTTTIAE